jgi:hypothetical protein
MVYIYRGVSSEIHRVGSRRNRLMNDFAILDIIFTLSIFELATVWQRRGGGGWHLTESRRGRREVGMPIFRVF